MKMEWSPEAVEQLRARFGAKLAGFRIVYDIDGCGCAVNGVPALWAVNEGEPGDAAAESGPFPLWHAPQQQVFFEEALRISYLPERRSFSLTSDSQTYTTRLVIEDRRASQIQRKEDESIAEN